MREPEQALDPKVQTMWRFSASSALHYRHRFFYRTRLRSIVVCKRSIWSTQRPIWMGVTHLCVFRLIHAVVWPMYEYRFYRYDINDDHLLVQGVSCFADGLPSHITASNMSIQQPNRTPVWARQSSAVHRFRSIRRWLNPWIGSGHG